jgi:hypothetical protein
MVSVVMHGVLTDSLIVVLLLAEFCILRLL